MQALYYVSIFAFPQVDNSKKVKKDSDHKF